MTRGAPPGSRQIYIFNRVSRTYLGSKILNNEITINQKLEFKAVLDVQEITIYLDGVEVLHLDNVNLPSLDGPYFGCSGSNINTKLFAIAIQQLDLDLAAPRLQLPTASVIASITGRNLTLARRGAE